MKRTFLVCLILAFSMPALAKKKADKVKRKMASQDCVYMSIETNLTFGDQASDMETAIKQLYTSWAAGEKNEIKELTDAFANEMKESYNDFQADWNLSGVHLIPMGTRMARGSKQDLVTQEFLLMQDHSFNVKASYATNVRPFYMAVTVDTVSKGGKSPQNGLMRFTRFCKFGSL